MSQFHFPCKRAAEMTSLSPIRGFASKDTVTEKNCHSSAADI